MRHLHHRQQYHGIRGCLSFIQTLLADHFLKKADSFGKSLIFLERSIRVSKTEL